MFVLINRSNSIAGIGVIMKSTIASTPNGTDRSRQGIFAEGIVVTFSAFVPGSFREPPLGPLTGACGGISVVTADTVEAGADMVFYCWS